MATPRPSFASPNVDVVVMSSSFGLTMKRDVRSVFAHHADKNVSFVTARNTGRMRRPHSGSASSVVRLEQTWVWAFPCTTAGKSGGSTSVSGAPTAVFWAASRDGRLAIRPPNNC